ncbi:hypothetical protein AOA77_22190 [Pseudomonas paraeruginosa]|nr:hypothetical protein AN920_19820 [Pseudomonas paraeruginosa]KQB30046.1 hypothetical protein AOA77_22190 [Pseudomonas paraeruginosa]PHJ31942.1 hypothetical protein CDG78_14265 [Pseudomonas paraeruginosa]RQF88435.1 hypothetical protein IPC241_10780 [Pseudomonas aeruginosa]
MVFIFDKETIEITGVAALMLQKEGKQRPRQLNFEYFKTSLHGLFRGVAPIGRKENTVELFEVINSICTF